MATSLLEGIRVVDLAGEPAAIAGRVLADLGADVVLVEPPGGVPLRALLHTWAAWVSVTPFGIDGPRAGWGASDLGVMAAQAGAGEAVGAGWQQTACQRPPWDVMSPFPRECCL